MHAPDPPALSPLAMIVSLPVRHASLCSLCAPSSMRVADNDRQTGLDTLSKAESVCGARGAGAGEL